MLTWGLVILGVLAGLVGVMALIGSFLPQGHTASRSVTLQAPPERVFAAITDVARYPQWRPDVRSVEVLAAEGPFRFRESGKQGTVTYREIERQAPVRWVVRIDDPSLPYGGSWTYAVRGEGTGSVLTITEDGEVYNPVFRFLSRTVFSTVATMEKYQADLRVYLDAKSESERLP